MRRLFLGLLCCVGGCASERTYPGAQDEAETAGEPPNAVRVDPTIPVAPASTPTPASKPLPASMPAPAPPAPAPTTAPATMPVPAPPAPTTAPAPTTVPAPTPPASVDAETLALVRAAREAYQRNIAARCPCLVAHGDFLSIADCSTALGRGVGWVDCVSTAAGDSDRDRANVRAYLTCFSQGVRTTNTCLESASCADHEVAACDALRPDCPPPDAALLTKIAARCADSVGFR